MIAFKQDARHQTASVFVLPNTWGSSTRKVFSYTIQKCIFKDESIPKKNYSILKTQSLQTAKTFMTRCARDQDACNAAFVFKIEFIKTNWNALIL